MSSKSDLILSLMEKKGMSLEEAKAFAEEFFEEHPEPVAPPPVAGFAATPGFPVSGLITGAIPMRGVSKGGLPVPAIGQDDLKRQQVAEYVQAGIKLCPNCQQPTTDHLPACARASGEDPKAVTKNPLPPVG